MATRVVILEQLDSSAVEQRYRYILWADVPAARQPFWKTRAPAASAWMDASSAQTAAITSGAIAEKVETLIVPAGMTLAQIRTALQNAFTAWQTTVTAYDPWVRYGSVWDDSTGWAAGGV